MVEGGLSLFNNWKGVEGGEDRGHTGEVIRIICYIQYIFIILYIYTLLLLYYKYIEYIYNIIIITYKNGAYN